MHQPHNKKNFGIAKHSLYLQSIKYVISTNSLGTTKPKKWRENGKRGSEEEITPYYINQIAANVRRG